MASPQMEIYTLSCVLADELSVFPIEIESDRSVYGLKEKIKDTKNALDKFAAFQLQLYHVEISKFVDMAKREKANAIKRKFSEHPARLHAMKKLANVFKDGVKEESLIIVQPPTRGSGNFSYAQAIIKRFMEEMRPVIRKYVAGARFSYWAPPDGVTQETKDFYAKLQIPRIYQKPNLLLHALGESPNPNGDALFSGENQILCSTSGSGKTRLLFEGLSKHWGFYWTIAKGADGIGSADMVTVIEETRHDPSWIPDIFKSQSATDVQHANKTNSSITTKAMLKVLLARWSIFRLFVEEARNQGRSIEDLKQDWLYFQILAPSPYLGDPFRNFIYRLYGFSVPDLEILRDELSPWHILGSDFNEKFFYVFNEIQIARREFLDCFSDVDGAKKQPVLVPILRTLELYDYSYPVIVSGTAFSQDHFETPLVSSSMGKLVDEAWKAEYSTGDFTDSATQTSYIERYLPASYLNSPSGLALMKRMNRWLRGRHIFTATFIEQLLQRKWDEAGPVAPHRLLNLYIDELSSFIPNDDGGFLVHEPRTSLDPLGGFRWDLIDRKDELLRELAVTFYTSIIQGKLPIWLSGRESLVEYGLARFIRPGETSMQKPSVAIEEPLALLSVMRHLESKQLALRSDIRRAFQSDEGPAFKNTLVFAMTKLLQNDWELGTIFDFWETPQWAGSSAQILARSASGAFENFGDHQLKAPSTQIVFHANTPAEVRDWLEHGEAPWCFPGEAIGPDLLTRVRLDDERVLLLVIHAQSHFSGNADTVVARYTAEAIGKVTPNKFFSSLKSGHSQVKKMLEAINLKNHRFTDGRYNILRVVVAFPVDANFSSSAAGVQKALKEDSHTLAKLKHSALISTLADPEGESTISMLKNALKRRHDGDEMEVIAPQKG